MDNGMTFTKTHLLRIISSVNADGASYIAKSLKYPIPDDLVKIPSYQEYLSGRPASPQLLEAYNNFTAPLRESNSFKWVVFLSMHPELRSIHANRVKSTEKLINKFKSDGKYGLSKDTPLGEAAKKVAPSYLSALTSTSKKKEGAIIAETEKPAMCGACNTAGHTHKQCETFKTWVKPGEAKKATPAPKTPGNTPKPGNAKTRRRQNKAGNPIKCHVCQGPHHKNVCPHRMVDDLGLPILKNRKPKIPSQAELEANIAKFGMPLPPGAPSTPPVRPIYPPCQHCGRKGHNPGKCWALPVNRANAPPKVQAILANKPGLYAAQARIHDLKGHEDVKKYVAPLVDPNVPRIPPPEIVQRIDRMDTDLSTMRSDMRDILQSLRDIKQAQTRHFY